MTTYQSFCGPKSCTIQSEYHSHYKCVIVGCKYVVPKKHSLRYTLTFFITLFTHFTGLGSDTQYILK